MELCWEEIMSVPYGGIFRQDSEGMILVIVGYGLESRGTAKLRRGRGGIVIVRGCVGFGSGVGETSGAVGKTGTVGKVLLRIETSLWRGGIVFGKVISCC